MEEKSVWLLIRPSWCLSSSALFARFLSAWLLSPSLLPHLGRVCWNRVLRFCAEAVGGRLVLLRRQAPLDTTRRRVRRAWGLLHLVVTGFVRNSVPAAAVFEIPPLCPSLKCKKRRLVSLPRTAHGCGCVANFLPHPDSVSNQTAGGGGRSGFEDSVVT